MAIHFKNRKNKLLALFMAMMMSSSVAAMAACNDDDDSSSSDSSSSESTTVDTDSSRINNGSFEFVDWNNNKNLIITSPTGWSRSANSATSGTAVSSKSASGIINTDADAWDNFTKSSLPAGTAAPTNAEEASKLWDKMSAYDKLKFYEVWDDGDFDEKLEDQDFYDANTDKFNVDIDDVPVDQDGNIIANPGTHAADDEDSSVLMIHNAYTGGAGTAQRFTSSSTITLEAGTSAEISLWVKTSNLTYLTQEGSQSVVNERGAYIGVTHTVGGTTLDQLQIKNINTAGVTENNGWQQYTLYVQGSSFASSTFTMVLGLGQGGGTDRFEYVEGYAFFDDVTCNIISNEEYETKTEAMEYKVSLDTEADGKVFEADKVDINSVALNLNSGATSFEDIEIPTLSVGLTEQTKNGVTYVAADNGDLNGKVVYNGLGFETKNDVNGVFSKSELIAKAANNEYVKAALKEGFGYTEGSDKLDFVGDKTLLLLSANGANYTAKSATYTLKAGEKIGISFFVKTSDMLGVTGANVTVRYGGTEDKMSKAATIATINTTGIASIDTDNEEDIYQGWQQCFLFIENDTDIDDLAYTVEFSYGPSTIVGATKDSFIEGWAAFTNFQKISDMGDAFDYATSGTYSKVVSLFDSEETVYSSSKFDEAAYVTGVEAIKTGFANLRNYTGVKGDSAYVKNDPTADKSKNSNEYAGLLSKEYIDEYDEIATLLGADLNNVFGNATQPLVIYNKEESAYGFIANSASAISGYSAISVRVKVSEGAIAYVYLADMDDANHSSILSIDRRVSYWYDANGNVCSVDPTSEEFDKKQHIVLELQENGLYQAKDGGDYYANLKAYTEKDAAGNLLVAEGGVEYNYNSHWNNEGVDGIAYYYADGKYYADAAKKVLVKDFSEYGDNGIPTRYDAMDGKDLSVKVTDTKGEWKTVTFYVAAGADTKNYRLEVWSGSRDGLEKSAADSYVLFDTNTAGSLDASSFATLTQNAFDYLVDAENFEDEDALTEAYKANGKLVYNAYSFYDDAKFLRYNKDLDENEVENSYDDYDSTAASYAEIISYFFYENTKFNAVSVFANYTQNDVTVPVDVVEDEHDHDHDTEEDTTSESDLDLGMLISSLAVAGVLVAVLVLVGVRKLVKVQKAPKIRKPAKKVKKD